MNKPFAISLLLLSACFVQPTSAADTGKPAEQQIRDIETRRFKAMLGPDIETLQAMLAEEVLYIHSSGAVETKVQFLEALSSGKMRYLSLDVEEMKVRVYGDVSIVNGLLKLDVRMGGKPSTFRVRYTDAYARRDDRWELVTWQSTRLPE